MSRICVCAATAYRDFAAPDVRKAPLRNSLARPERETAPLRWKGAPKLKATESSWASEDATPAPRPFYSSPYDAEILRVAFPALCSGLLQPLCTAVDTGVVGQLGPLQLSGLGVGAVVYMFLSNLFLFCQFLITPAVAKAEAQKETTQLSRIIGRSIQAGILAGCLVGVVVFFMTDFIIEMLHPPLAVRGFAAMYLRVMATSIPPFILYQCLAGILRGLKDTFTIFKSSGIATIANIILDVIFVFGFNWGVFGAALATSLCTFVSTGMMLHKVLTSGKVKKKDLLGASLVSSSGGAGKVLGDGLALIVRTMALLGLIVSSSIMVAQQGPIIHSAYEICRLVFLLAHVTYTAFDVTMQALCASYIGRNDKNAARAVLLRALQIVIFVTAVMSGGLFLYASGFARLFTSNPEVMAEFRKVAAILLVPIPLGAAAAAMDGSLLGASRFKYVAASQLIVALIAMYLLFSFHRSKMLTLMWTAIFVRIGLSSQVLFSWWVAFGMEYKKSVKASL